MLTFAERVQFNKAARIIAGESAKNYLISKFMIYDHDQLVHAIERRMPEAMKKASEGAMRQLNLNNSLNELGQQNFALTIMEAGVEAAKEVGRYPSIADAIPLKVGAIPNEKSVLDSIPDDPFTAIHFSK